MANVVTRFAPSPTGFMHVGGVRTALYAWLFARQNGGSFILRIEDTDKEREVPGSLEHIVESLSWLGLTWDLGPLPQSQRLELYRSYARRLIEKKLAYPDPYTQQELETLRQKAQEEKRPFLFREHRPAAPGVWDGTRPLRFRVPEIKRYAWHDLVRGTLSAGEEALDDFILIKSDGYPTYNFAHIVDDIEMGVTHVIRGEEFISSTPKFLSLYEALGIPPPQFATMPAILGPDGKKKLSKRDGAKDILEYRSEGYLPEALVNFLALLGWHPEGEREVMTASELVEAFRIERVQKAGAAFDETKLLWLNHEHLRLLSPEEFLRRLRQYVEEQGATAPAYLGQVSELIRERARTFAEARTLIEDGEFSFMEKAACDRELLLKGAKSDLTAVQTHLDELARILSQVPDREFAAPAIQSAVMPYADANGRSAVLWPLRVALSGKERSPDPFTMAALVGKGRTLERIAAAREAAR